MEPVTFVESSEGQRIAVHNLGGPRAGEAAALLLFSHATGFHGRVWAQMASHLHDRYRCLALDYRGHGQSTLAAGASLAWSRMAEDARAVVEQVARPGESVHGVGHSMGGAALALAEDRHPGSFRSLWLYEPVIIPPGGLISADGPNPMADGAIRRRSTFASMEQAYENFASKEPLRQLAPAALRDYVEGGFEVEVDGSVTLRCAPEIEAEVFRQARGGGAWAVIPQLALPVTVVAGRMEPYGPVAFAPAVAAALPRGRLIERPDLGHFGPLEDPRSMAGDLATWVQEVTPG
jgi:pimeloyl-ACP methyl ester carboxylesterase